MFPTHDLELDLELGLALAIAIEFAIDIVALGRDAPRFASL